MAFVEQIGLHAWDKAIDLGMILGSLLIGGPIYLSWLKLLSRFENYLNSSVQTHFAQCALLYLSALFLAWQLWLNHGSKSIGYAYGVLVLACVAVGIAANWIFIKYTAQSEC